MTPGTIFEPRPQKPRWGCLIAMTTVFLLLLVVLLFPMGGGGKESAKRTMDLYNLKQIGTALGIYLVDNEDRFPPDMSSPRAGLKYFGEYIKSNERGEMWSLRSLVTDSPEYLGNGSLALKWEDEIKDSGRVITYFDSAPFPNKRRNVLFADMSVRSREEGVFQKAVANGWRELPEEPGK